MEISMVDLVTKKRHADLFFVDSHHSIPTFSRRTDTMNLKTSTVCGAVAVSGKAARAVRYRIFRP